ncbi:hypothetical protein L7F22_020308 [Adiantum nelumboides]|nr:hypothetical protein [Adiantum nelumboides]
MERSPGQEPTDVDRSLLYTSTDGRPYPSLTTSLKVGAHPVQSDSLLLEKQQAFDRMKIQERIVHPSGSSAFGRFEVTHNVSKLTKAKMFQLGQVTPAYTRFSTVTLGREYPDSARNPRGFATKFYTEDGNYDLVGLNWPIFFVRDPWLGPDNIRSQQRNPSSFLLDFEAWFDFFANVPESNHTGLMLLSDHGTPVGWRYMSGFGCHTFSWVNASGERTFIKYHWLSQQGTRNHTLEEATKMCGENPNYAKRDLWMHLAGGGKCAWQLCVQTMTPDEADKVEFDPFDVTKVWPRDQFKMQPVGKLTLDRNPENYFRDVEQAAFSPGSMVPGIEASPDSLLLWRMFFYRDAQYHRLGVNLHQVPVNCPPYGRQPECRHLGRGHARRRQQRRQAPIYAQLASGQGQGRPPGAAVDDRGASGHVLDEPDGLGTAHAGALGGQLPSSRQSVRVRPGTLSLAREDVAGGAPEHGQEYSLLARHVSECRGQDSVFGTALCHLARLRAADCGEHEGEQGRAAGRDRGAEQDGTPRQRRPRPLARHGKGHVVHGHEAVSLPVQVLMRQSVLAAVFVFLEA